MCCTSVGMALSLRLALGWMLWMTSHMPLASTDVSQQGAGHTRMLVWSDMHMYMYFINIPNVAVFQPHTTHEKTTTQSALKCPTPPLSENRGRETNRNIGTQKNRAGRAHAQSQRTDTT